MLKIIYTAAVLIAIVFCNSCTNTFDVTDDYKDTTIVYAVLNQSDVVQYIKIYKAYLGEGDALVMAQQTDSFYYKDELDVTLERWKNNVLSGVIDFIRDSSLVMDTGVFANFPNISYKSKDADSIYDDSSYRLVIKNRSSGKDVFASTAIIDKFYAVNQINPFIDLLQNPFKVTWNNAQDARFYQISFRFHYAETNIASGTFENKYVDWKIGEVDATGFLPGSPVSIKIYPDDFYVYLRSKLEPDATLYRSAGYIDIIYEAGNEDLYQYYTINNYNNGLSQTLPSFTNINNGLGIFASRYNQSVLSRTLTARSLDSLAFGRYTYDLGF